MSDILDASDELVRPQTLKGFQDLLPEDMIVRERVVEKIKRVYEKYGFVPLDTPVLEYLVTLVGTGGEETNKTLFRLQSPEREPIAMRFDLTVPFARLIAQYPEKLKLPFRRYHMGPVFRADDPAPGRFRQFTQFDIDAAGSESVAIDAEVVSAMCDVMRVLGLRNSGTKEYLIRINNRKLVDALLEGCGIREESTIKHVLRVVDKLQKIGLDNVCKELGEEGRIDDSGDPIRGVGLPSTTIDRIISFITVSHPTRRAVIDALTNQLPASPVSSAALREMSEMAEALDALGVSDTDAIYDPSLARGLDYYTGPVYEAFLLGAPKVGSVMGGGRYDNLVRRFLKDRVPATGVSIGLDRLMAGLRMAGKIEPVATTVQALIVAMRGFPIAELLKVSSELRARDISSTVYFGKPGTNVQDQLSYANTNGIPIAILLGDDEFKNGTISVKNLKAGKEMRAEIQDREEYRKASKAGQKTVARGELTETVRAFLSQAQ